MTHELTAHDGKDRQGLPRNSRVSSRIRTRITARRNSLLPEVEALQLLLVLIQTSH
jgi:hypothetical protein